MSPKTDDGPAATKDNSDKMDVDKKKAEDFPEEDLSEEDKQLKEELELCVQRLKEPDAKLYPNALETLGKLIKASTTSMTSVPKPLKFMIPHFEAMKEVQAKMMPQDGPMARQCADVVSVLAMTMSEDCETLR